MKRLSLTALVVTTIVSLAAFSGVLAAAQSADVVSPAGKKIEED